MKRLLPALVLTLATSATLAAADPACAEHERLRDQRDKALQAKNFKGYCEALSGLIRLMPAQPPGPARLQCEAQANKLQLNTWLGMRPDVLSTMATTFAEHCR